MPSRCTGVPSLGPRQGRPSTADADAATTRGCPRPPRPRPRRAGGGDEVVADRQRPTAGRPRARVRPCAAASRRPPGPWTPSSRRRRAAGRRGRWPGRASTSSAPDRSHGDDRRRRRPPWGSAATVGPSETSTASRSCRRDLLRRRAGRRGAARARSPPMRHVPHAVVRGAVAAGDAGAVEHERHAGPVQGAVHQHLVEGAVEEGRVDRDHGVQPAEGQPGRHGHARAARRCRRRRCGRGRRAAKPSSPTGISIAAVIATTSGRSAPIAHHLVAELVGPDPAARLERQAGLGVDDPDGVELVGLVVAGRVVAAALLGEDVHDAPARRRPRAVRSASRPPARRGRRPGRGTSGRGPRTSPAGRRCP